MSAAVSRPRRREAPEARAKRIADLLARRNRFHVEPLPRVAPIEETLYRTLGHFAPTPTSRFVDGRYVGLSEIHRAWMRVFALRAWLARRLARMSDHAGFEIMWRGCAREAVYKWRLHRRAFLMAKSEGR